MNKMFSKVLSAILILATLLSICSVLAFAAEDGSGDTTTNDTPVDLSQIDLIYNRNFEEGWDYNNGFSAISAHKAYIDYEETATYKYNYFWRVEATDTASAAASTLEIGAIRESGTVVQFKIKADDSCSLGRIMYMTTPGKKTVSLLYISGRTLYAFQSGAPAYKIGELTNDWLTVKLVFDWDASRTLADGTTDTLFKCRVYYGDDGAYFDYEANYEMSKDKGMKSLSIGLEKPTKDVNGMSYCIDDLQIYQKVKEPLDLSGVTDYGSKINPLAPVVVDIQDGPGNKSTEQIINEALCMKVGVSSALIKNKKTYIEDIYCVPENVDGNVMLPLNLLLDFIGYPFYEHGGSYDITTGTSATYITIGRDTANVDGERIALTVAPGYITNANGVSVPVIAAADFESIFPGWNLTYDDMGLIIIYQGVSEDGGELINRETDLDVMLTIMKKFVFDTVTEDEDGNEFDEIEESYIATGEKVIADVIANATSRPYIFADKATFDKLSALYTSTNASDAKAKGYLTTLIGEADAIFAEYAIVDVNTGKYLGMLSSKKPANVYNDGKNPDPAILGDKTVADTTDGYEPAGTLVAIKAYSEHLFKLAFAYQITGNANYAELALGISRALGEWTHWGPADAESCATAVGNFAIAYDWLYNYYLSKQDGEQIVTELAGILYNKGVKHGYNASSGASCEFPRSIGGGDVYHTADTYINAVCSSNMIIGALALIGRTENVTECAFLIGNNFQNLIANGLDQYAPDGSYAESALMWADATNGLVKLIMALESAAGTTYGFDDMWGLDKTFYFACYIEDSDGKIWNYHEGGADGVVSGEILGVDTQMFNYASKFLSDPTLLAIRQNQLNKGKPVTIFDMLFYPDGDIELEEELALDYQMEGIHAFVSRSDWESGALYTGIMGGSNNVYGGQLDSGNFIYRNKGINWIIDLGSDNTAIYSYYGSYRNHHYRNNAEGQNVIVITSAQSAIPYGQLPGGSGIITSTFTNEHGSYAIIENTSAYGSTVSFANRGLLVTNDRKTVVIQDEMSFQKFQEVNWLVHTASSIQIDASGKVAYLTDTDPNGRTYILRATIVSNADYTFRTETCDPGRILDVTYKASDYKANGGEQPYSRASISRLVIRAKNVLNFNVAVAFEIVDTMDSDLAVGYQWNFMSAWNPSNNESSENVSNVVRRGTPVKNDITNEAIVLDMYAETFGTAYTENIDDFYYSLTKIAYTVKTYSIETLDTTTLMDAYSTYEEHLNTYEKYIKKVNGAVGSTINLARGMSGITIK